MDVVLLHEMNGVVRVQRWRRGHPQASGCAYVTVGHCDDAGVRRWFVHYTGRAGRGDAWLCDDETHARRLAAESMTVGVWVEAPAAFDARHEPVDRWRWRKSGGLWELAEPGDGQQELPVV